jgi:starch-binding outer membrane protein, SusD/RagB family
MKKLILSVLVLLLSLTACDDILEKTDLTGVDERVWDTESTATLYLNRVYDLVMPVFVNMRSATTLPIAIHTISDESNTGDSKPLYGTLGVDHVSDFWGNNSNNVWSYIRKINILLTEIEKGSLSQEAKDKIKGQAFFLRAWLYFSIVKLYGGVPIITHPQDWVADDLYTPRNKTSECIDFIISDLDTSIALLKPGMPATQSAGDRGRITRDTSLAFKGRVMLYWASPQFNPSGDAQRWEAAYQVNKAAYDSLTRHGYALFSSFANVLTDEGTGNKEVIMIRSYDGANRSSTFENVARPVSESSGGGGGFQPTWELVKAFPMKNGLPSMVNGVAANGFDTLYYWKDRDPRFAATVAYNGAVWELSNKVGRKQWNYLDVAEDKSRQTATGFYCRKGLNTKLLAANAALGTTDWVEMRFAEVMLNLAECANATDRISEAYTMLTAIRQRAGITNGNGFYGLAPSMNRQAMFEAIMNERQIELAFEGKRYDDLRRTRLFHTLNGKRRHGLVAIVKAPFKVADLEKKDANGVMLRDKLDLNGADYTTYFTPGFAIIDTQNPINFLNNYYFYGIPTTNLQRNLNLVQTMDWGGDFNPLE